LSRVEEVFLIVYRCKFCGAMWGDRKSAARCDHEPSPRATAGAAVDASTTPGSSAAVDASLDPVPGPAVDSSTEPICDDCGVPISAHEILCD